MTRRIRGKFCAEPRRRSRTCPVCGKWFDAKNMHITVCPYCERMMKRGGKHVRRNFE